MRGAELGRIKRVEKFGAELDVHALADGLGTADVKVKSLETGDTEARLGTGIVAHRIRRRGKEGGGIEVAIKRAFRIGKDGILDTERGGGDAGQTRIVRSSDDHRQAAAQHGDAAKLPAAEHVAPDAIIQPFAAGAEGEFVDVVGDEVLEADPLRRWSERGLNYWGRGNWNGRRIVRRRYRFAYRR